MITMMITMKKTDQSEVLCQVLAAKTMMMMMMINIMMVMIKIMMVMVKIIIMVMIKIMMVVIKIMMTIIKIIMMIFQASSQDPWAAAKPWTGVGRPNTSS